MLTVEEALRTAAHGDPDGTLVVGDASGGDKIATDYACGQGWRVEVHRANWARFGRAAGPIRNAEMVESGADRCLAFIEDHSRGATHCAQLAERAGVPVSYFLDCDCCPLGLIDAPPDS